MTITYAHPVAGATAPTAAQASRFNLLTCKVLMADADTQAVITHNWRVSTAKLAKLFPLACVYTETPGTAAAILSIKHTNSVAVTLTKDTAVGSGGTFVVVLHRPHSIVS